METCMKSVTVLSPYWKYTSYTEVNALCCFEFRLLGLKKHLWQVLTPWQRQPLTTSITNLPLWCFSFVWFHFFYLFIYFKGTAHMLLLGYFRDRQASANKHYNFSATPKPPSIHPYIFTIQDSNTHTHTCNVNDWKTKQISLHWND